MTVSRMSPEDHDRVLARTSHLPHAVAAVLSGMLTDGDVPYSATGFRDTTRVAAGDVALWTAIFRSNAGPLAEELGRLKDRISQLQEGLQVGDDALVNEILASGRERRIGLEAVVAAVVLNQAGADKS